MNKKELAYYDSLIMSRRQVSIVIGGSLFFFFIVFMLGYFLGTKHTTEEFIAQASQEIFAEQLFSSVQSACVNSSELKNTIKTESQNKKELVAQDYAAELIGFGIKKSAESFINRIVQEMNIPLKLRIRNSVTKLGKTITWYQVVTTQYSNREELESIVEMIVKKEHLHDIHIIAC